MDWLSFLIGIVVGVVVMIATGFWGEAGKDLWLALKRKYRPPPPSPPEPLLVDTAFKPTQYAAGDCVWARHDSLYRKESEGYTYYLEPSNRRKIMRNNGQQLEFLMVKPGAAKSM